MCDSTGGRLFWKNFVHLLLLYYPYYIILLFYDSKICKHSKQPGEARAEFFVFIYKKRLGRSTVGVKNEERI